MRFLRLASLCSVLVLCSAFACAQATGLYAFGSFDNRGFDTVNRGNLNTHFSIPILSKPGRGGTNFSYALAYDSLLWSPVTSGSTTSWTPSPTWGWTENTPASWGYVTYTLFTSQCMTFEQSIDTYAPFNALEFTNYVYHDSNGGTHPFSYQYFTNQSNPGGELSGPICQTYSNGPSSASYSLTDNSGLTIYRNGDGSSAAFVAFTPGGSSAAVSAVATSGNAVQYPSTLGPAVYTDTNGNEISTDGRGDFYDTMSSTKPVLTLSGTAPSSTVYTYTDSNGKSQTITVAYSAYTVATNFGVSGITEYPPTSAYLISSITYNVDGSAYDFTYEPTPGRSGQTTGRIQQITLRTGGTISYTFGTMQSDGTIASLKRTTTDGSIAYTRTSVQTPYTTQLVDATGNYTVLQFMEDSLGHFYESDRKVYTGNTSGSFLLEVLNCYNDTSSTCTQPNVNGGIGALNTVITTGTQGFCCNVNGSYYQDIQYFQGPELLSSDSMSGLSYSYNNYTGQYGLPFYRVSGITPPNSKSATYVYNYDENNPTPTSGLPQHANVFTTRGNLTSQQIILNSSQTLTQKQTYDDAGQVLTSSDWNGNVTSYAYDSSTDTLLTKTTLPKVGSNAAMTVGSNYDVNTGLLLSITDANGQVTCYQYDGLLRPSLTIAPDGGQVQEAYTGETQVVQSVLQSGGKGNSSTCTPLTSGTNRVTTATLDKYGRPSTTVQTDSTPGNETVSYTYDANGRLYSVTNPHRGTASPTDGTTYYAYDGLGNVATITRPDSSTVSSTFNVPIPNTQTGSTGAVKVVDEAGNIKYWVPDQYGRVSSVYEMDPTTGVADYVTSYSYDYMGHLGAIEQQGNAGSLSSYRYRNFYYDMAGRLTETITPEEGTIAYNYLTTGNAQCSGSFSGVCVRMDNDKRTTTYTYDSLNRLTGKSYSGTITPSVSYTYDATTATLGVNPYYGLGRLTSMTNGTVQTAYGYGPAGRVIAFGDSINGIVKTGAYNYNVDGTMASVTAYNGAQTNYFYNAVGQPSSAVDVNTGLTFVSGVNYDPAGQLLSMVRNSGSVTFTSNNAYNNRLQPTLLSAQQGSGTFMSLSYSYGPLKQDNGNISQTTNNLDSSRSVAYGYDVLNRLTQAYTSTWGNNYTYDAWGNLTAKTAYKTLPGESMSYSMNTSNQFIPPNGSLMTYDKAGEMTVDNSGNNYTYDNEGRVTQVNNGSYVTTYTYDGNGLRVGKQSTQASKLYWYGPDSKLLNESDTSGNISDRFGWFNGEMVGRLDTSGPLHFIYHDHLGSARVVMSQAGQLQDDLDYYPFGTVIPREFTSGNNYQFTGYETDSESNIEHAWFRNLSPGLGRYMRPDPYAGSYQTTDPQSMNRYSYVGNRPIIYYDLLGLHLAEYIGGGCYQVSDDYDAYDSSDGPDSGDQGTTTSILCTGFGGGSGAATEFGGGFSDCKNRTGLGIGAVLGADGAAGVPGTGAGATGSAGAGEFFGGPSGASGGSYISGGAAGNIGNPTVGIPSQNFGGIPSFVGLGAGAAIGLFLTNASSVSQLNGPFLTIGAAASAGEVGLSGQGAFGFDPSGNLIWQVSLSWAPGIGAYGYVLTTNTKASQQAGCQ